jgi:hypothetical protein
MSTLWSRSPGLLKVAVFMPTPAGDGEMCRSPFHPGYHAAWESALTNVEGGSILCAPSACINYSRSRHLLLIPLTLPY